MNAVGLIEFGNAADALEKKWQQNGMVLPGEIGKDLGKGIHVRFAHAGGHSHSGNNNLDGRVFVPREINNGLEIGFRGGGGKAAQAVIAAQLQDQNRDGLAQQPADAGDAVRTGVTGDASVNDFEREPGGVDFLLQQSGIGLVQIDPEAGGETIAQDENIPGGVAGEWKNEGKKRQ